MERISRIWAAITAGVLFTFVVPAVAWAEETGVAEQLRKKPKIGGGIFGVLGLVCCLVVVGGIVLVVFLVMKNKKK